MSRAIHVLQSLQPYIKAARSFSGWDFQNIRVKPLEPGPPWDYEATAREFVRLSDSILDLGTGGGERLSTIVAGLPGRVVATEAWAPNVPVAYRRLGLLGVHVVRCSSLRLPFANAAFDLVLDRHEELEPAEIVRVLRPGGRFLTEQVDRNDWQKLARYFRLTDFGDQFTEYKRALEARGMIVEGGRHDRKVAYGGLGDVVFMMLVSPFKVPDFDPEWQIDALPALEDKCGTPDGIVLTESKLVLMARKTR